MNGEAADASRGQDRQTPRQQRHWMPSWKLPLLFGIGLCALQVTLALGRFGAGRSLSAWIRPDLLLFFIAGFLAGWLSDALLRGTNGTWRKLLIACIATAAVFAVPMSLLGGLFGPPVVVLGGLLPFLAIAGVPALSRSLWIRFRRAGA